MIDLHTWRFSSTMLTSACAYFQPVLKTLLKFSLSINALGESVDSFTTVRVSVVWSACFCQARRGVGAERRDRLSSFVEKRRLRIGRPLISDSFGSLYGA